MTITYNNTFVNGISLVTGPYEKRGPLSRFFDKTYEDFYFNRPTWEQAESKLIEDSVDILLKKIGKTKFDIDVHVSGDLLNQLASTNYASSNIGIPLLGVYSACATSMEGVIIGANMVDKGIVKNCIASVSSHNEAAEKQFRYPTEYGGPKPKTATFTNTGGASIYLSKEKSDIKVESSTIGRVVDYSISQQKAIYDGSFLNLEDKDAEIKTNPVSGDEEEYDDPLYNDIVEFVITTGKASASLLQRRFKLGYNRAARIIDLLEERGIIGPQNGSKPREVLVKLEGNEPLDEE